VMLCVMQLTPGGLARDVYRLRPCVITHPEAPCAEDIRLRSEHKKQHRANYIIKNLASKIN
jgi:hypothetical protein